MLDRLRVVFPEFAVFLPLTAPVRPSSQRTSMLAKVKDPRQHV
jgi:hypothetical protein